MYLSSKKIESKVQRLREMQSYVILNRYFIRELEVTGGDTKKLMEELKELEYKIQTLRLQCGDQY
jgi:hypothetical protein